MDAAKHCCSEHSHACDDNLGRLQAPASHACLMYGMLGPTIMYGMLGPTIMYERNARSHHPPIYFLIPSVVCKKYIPVRGRVVEEVPRPVHLPSKGSHFLIPRVVCKKNSAQGKILQANRGS